MTTDHVVPLWVWWIPLVCAISVPWTGLSSHPQWSRVHPIPFTDPADRPRDVIANIVLFVPFGYSCGRGRSWWKVVAIAAVVSLIAEGTQLFSTTRYPSATDVTAGLVGAAIGAFGSSLVLRSRP